MHKSLASIFEGFSFSGDITSDVLGFLHYHGCKDVAKHVLAVSEKAKYLANIYDADPELAYCAGLLHDISLVFEPDDILQTSIELGIELVVEERKVPYLIHGKLSATIAEMAFGIKNDSITHAISCHTTLCANPTSLDKILFLADKMSWDHKHSPFRLELEQAVEKSLDEAVGCFLNWMWFQKDKLSSIHPLLIDAWNDYRSRGYCRT